MSVSFQVEGFAQLEEALKDLSNAASRGVGQRALVKAAEPLVVLIKSKTPVDEGDLQGSIAVSTKLDGRQAAMHRKIKGGAEAFVGPSYNIGDGGRHGHLVEFGTVHSAPHPFLRPSWEQDQKSMLDRVSEELRKEIDKALERARRKAARLAAKNAT